MLLDSRSWTAPLRRDARVVVAGWQATGRGVAAAGSWLAARRLELLELGFLLLALAGVALIHLPAAMILGGGLGVFGCERRSGARTGRSAAPAPRSERVA